jgi:hypothetical protein
MAALLAWLLLASSAGAAIQRHTDSRGVIHISNAPVKAAPAPQGNLAEKSGPQMAGLPEPAPPLARAEAQAPRPVDSAPPQPLETSPPADAPVAANILTFEAISYQAKGRWSARGRQGAIAIQEVYAGGPPYPGGRVA